MKDKKLTSKERLEHIFETMEEINSGIKGQTKRIRLWMIMLYRPVAIMPIKMAT